MTSPLPVQNPILQEINGLSPGAKTALMNAHAATSAPQPSPASPLQTQQSPQSSALISPEQPPAPLKMQAPSSITTPPQMGISAPKRSLSTQPAPAAPAMQAPKITPQMRQQAESWQDAGPTPMTMNAPSMGGAPPQMGPPPSSHSILMGPNRGEEMYSDGQKILPGTLTGDKIEQQRTIAAGPGEEQLYHKITGSHFGQEHPFLSKLLGGAAAGVTGAADIGLSTLGGGMGRLAAEMTPGTILNHQVQLGRDSKAVAGDEANAKDEADTQQATAQAANLDAQPELKRQAAQLAQDKLDEKRTHDQGTLQASLAQHGYAPDENNPGQIRPLRYDEMSPQQQAVTDLKGSQEELAEAQKAYKDAQIKNLPVQMQMAQQRMETAQRNAETAIQRLGLSSQEFQFNQDKQYNPEPTAQERRVGDLAQSAVDRVHEMRQIIADHPEFFGPGAGRATKFHAWIGSQDPEAQQFLSASRYLADHSAGVFGSRSVQITDRLEQLTNPDFNPDALNASLDEAERTARGFVNAGTPHGKGGSSSFKGDSGPPGGMVQVQIPGQRAGYIPSAALKQFKRDHPNAQVTQ